jgi:hypothetical protein
VSFWRCNADRLRKERDEWRDRAHSNAVEVLDVRDERDKYRRAVELIAEDCEAWLNSESDEPSAEFIKLVAKYAREVLQ